MRFFGGRLAMGLVLTRVTLERPAVVLPLALILIASAGGIIWTNATTQGRIRSAPTTSSLDNPSAKILISNVTIARGQVLNASDLSIGTIDARKVPAASFSQVEEAQGHMALRTINAGSPITKDEVSSDLATGIAALVPQGYRAYAVPVSEADIAGGFLEVGDDVDLYVTLPGALLSNTSNQIRGDRSEAVQLLEGVRVLAVGSKLHRGGPADPSVRTVTLALSSAELAKVALAARLGRISFAIRNPTDDRHDAKQYASVTALLSGKEEVRHPKFSRGITYLAGRERTVLPLP
jgi:pilus assembly protein CpaB